MSAPAWQVRPAGPGDAAALALVGAATFLDSFAGVLDGPALVAHCAAHHSAEACRALFAKGAQAWLGEAEPGGAPVGYAMLTPPDLVLARAGDIELKRIYTLSRWHGGGLGAALMAHAITAATSHARLLLGVHVHNARAIAFYRKHGFQPIGTRHFDVGGRLYDDLVLARDPSLATTGHS